MATLSASLNIFDVMARPLQNITNTSNQNITNTLNQTTIVMNQLVDQQENFNNSINKGVENSNNLYSKIKSFVGAYLNLETIKSGMEAVDNYTNQSTRIALINDGLQTQAQLQDKIFQAAQRSRASYGDTVNTVAKLNLSAKDVFKGNNEAIGFTELMNKSFKVGGGSSEERTAGMNQLTQAMTSGKLQGDGFEAINESAPMITQAIARYTGKSMGELGKMAEEGTISATIIKNALFSAADDINKKFVTMPMTFQDIWNSIKNQATMQFSEIMQKVSKFINSNNGKIFIQDITNSIGILSNVLNWVIDGVIAVSSFFNDNWGIIQYIIGGIAAVIAVILIPILWGAMAPIVAIGIAWSMLNLPVLLVIGAIVLFIYILNQSGVTAEEIVGAIAGTFWALGAFIWNVIAFIWNIIASLGEFLANLFTNPVYSVKRLFANLALSVLDMCISMSSGFDSLATNMANAIIDGINQALGAWNTFVDKLNSFGGIGDKLGLGKGTRLEHTASITSTFRNEKADINKWIDSETPKNYVTAPKMGMFDIKDSFNSGYSKGAKLDASISKMLDGAKVPEIPDFDKISNTSNALPVPVFDDAANKNLNGLGDKMDVSNEHLEMLRDLAEQDSIQNFVTLTPTVQVTTGDIREEADINKIIAKIETYMENELQNSAEGVYA